MIRFLLAIILVLDTALFTALMFMLIWRYGQRRINNKLMKVILSLPQGVIIFDSDKCFVASNEIARKLFIFSKDKKKVSVHGSLRLFKRNGELVHAKDHPINRAFGIKHSLSEVRYYIKTAKKKLSPVAISVANISIVKNQPMAICLVRDLAREELSEQMRRDFIGIASHQLRTPLTSLKWYGEMLTEDVRPKLHKKQRQFLDRINEATKRMINLVDDFLRVSQIEENFRPAHFDQIHIESLIQHIVEAQKPLIREKKLSVKITTKGRTRNLYADPATVREVLENFLVNAVKYNKIKGLVDIQIQFDNEHLTVSISDTGVGIPKDQHNLLFTKFFRAENVVTDGYEGTGLGLYTAKMLLDDLGGKVLFESEKEKGSKFWIQFPIDQRKK